jgi:GT2 family glycosyltransferase
MKKPFVTIVIPNWNGREDVIECLESINKLEYPGNSLEVIVVDTESRDGSQEAIKTAIKKLKKFKIRLIEIDMNVGAPESYNIGIHAANKKCKYIFKIDNDVVIEKNALKQMVDVAESLKEIGTCSAKQISYYNRNIIDSAGTIIYTDCTPSGVGGMPADEYNEQREIPAAPGASALYKKEMLDDIIIGTDYLDSEYFIYQDEFDLSWRALLRGWKCIYVPNAVVYHKGGASIRTRQRTSRRAKYFLERNRIWTITKNLQPKLIPYCLPHMIVYEIISWPFYLANSHLISVIKGRIHALAAIKRFIRKRREIQPRVIIKPEDMKRWFVRRNYAKLMREYI